MLEKRQLFHIFDQIYTLPCEPLDGAVEALLVAASVRVGACCAWEGNTPHSIASRFVASRTLEKSQAYATNIKWIICLRKQSGKQDVL